MLVKQLILCEYKKVDGDSTVHFVNKLIEKNLDKRIISLGMVPLIIEVNKCENGASVHVLTIDRQRAKLDG